jgi:tRNA acetyltransferase TAN1
MNDFNLIVSTYRFREEDAAEELLDILDRFGDSGAEAETTSVTGLILARTAMDPFEVVNRLKEVVSSEPWEVRYILRVMPIEKIVSPGLDDIQGAAGELASKIGQDESFRITVEKRHSDLHSREVIDYVADAIRRKVDLEDPGWVVLVEIIGKFAGVSIVRPGQIFSSVVEKRESSF